MLFQARRPAPAVGWVLWALCLGAVGCHHTQPCPPPPDVPRELRVVTNPPYIIEPPDILNIDALRLVPRPPYRISPLDLLGIQVTNTLPGQPIQGIYTVETDGMINLGFTYGAVPVVDLTLDEARQAIETRLKKILKEMFEVTVVLAEAKANQQVRGPHLVRPDGTVSLGVYGSVYVDSLTVPEAKAAIERHLSQFLLNPEVALDVSGYNSKVFYIVSDAATNGEQVTRLPVVGKTTILDAVSQVQGLSPVSSKKYIWLVRPAPDGTCAEQLLPVDWVAITQRGDTSTNYQMFAGDRLYVNSQPLVRAANSIDKFVAPFERALGFSLLIPSVYNSFAFLGTAGGGGFFGGIGGIGAPGVIVP